MGNHVCVVRDSTSLITNVLSVLLAQPTIQFLEFVNAKVERDLIMQWKNAYQFVQILKCYRDKNVNARMNSWEFKVSVVVVPCIVFISQKNKNAIVSLDSEELAKLANVQKVKSSIHKWRCVLTDVLREMKSLSEENVIAEMEKKEIWKDSVIHPVVHFKRDWMENVSVLMDISKELMDHVSLLFVLLGFNGILWKDNVEQFAQDLIRYKLMDSVFVFLDLKDNLSMEYANQLAHLIKSEWMENVFVLQETKSLMELVRIVQGILSTFMESVFVIMEILLLMVNAKNFHALIPIMSMIPSANHASVRDL